jgi:hypothetical protein
MQNNQNYSNKINEKLNVVSFIVQRVNDETEIV